MNKIQLQNLLAIVDMAQKSGIINPDDMLPAAISRKAAMDLHAQLNNDTHSVVPETKGDEQPKEAKSK